MAECAAGLTLRAQLLREGASLAALWVGVPASSGSLLVRPGVRPQAKDSCGPLRMGKLSCAAAAASGADVDACRHARKG